VHYPNLKNKHLARALFEPSDWWAYLRERDRLPSFRPTVGAIICYDANLWKWVSEYPGARPGDGQYHAGYLIPAGTESILAIRSKGIGAPAAVVALEEMAAFGIRNIVSIGTAGCLQPDMNVGDLVACRRAIRDEGTSYHYVPPSKYAEACPDLTGRLIRNAAAAGLSVREGASWTVDAPYRETVEEIRTYRDEGVLTVEMEASALFAIGAHRAISVAAMFAVSDILNDQKWTPGFHTEDVTKNLRKLFDVALACLASHGGVAEDHA